MSEKSASLDQFASFVVQDPNIPFEENFIREGTFKGKVLNRVAYGYRNLQNYKNRIILNFKFKPSDKQSEQ